MSEQLIWKAVSGDSEFQDDDSEIQIECASIVKGNESIFTVDCGEYYGISNEMEERIALCLNACEGLSNETLIKNGYLSAKKIKDLQERLCLKDLENVRLREAVSFYLSNYENLDEFEKLLSTLPTRADLDNLISEKNGTCST